MILILNLAWIAEQIAAGDLNQRVSGTERNDEIGRLAISFARMKRSVREKLQLINEQKEEQTSHSFSNKIVNYNLPINSKMNF